jgi:2-polyprenyl-6-methoxyphenol hydroxylase-like FAD-dependent oxidoreductase
VTAVERVAIIGGGVAGLGMARALELKGISCSVVDRLDEPPAGGLAINLPGNAVRALDQLGVLDQARQRGRPVGERVYRNASGKLLFRVDEDEFWGSFAPLCLRRSDLLEILRRANGDLQPRWGEGVSKVRPSRAGVELTMSTGGSETYDFVVGADGVNSVARGAIAGAETRPSPMSAASWRFMAPNPGVDCWSLWSGARGTALMIPVDEQEVYVYASATRGGSVEDPTWMSDSFADFTEPVPAVVADALAHPQNLYYSPIQEVRCERWSNERLVLIGDAAHAMGPIWAQGAALALEDALVLAKMMGAEDWGTVGAGFERRRRERVAHVQRATDKTARLTGLPSFFRDRIMSLAGPKSYRATYGPLREPAV